ncbi:lmo0937 family membrane protein [Synechococcus sp. CS-1332]|nr:lmo0937 family membrane protein [Synechococcus sp. CS-1332]MCT0208591.1 lmo0937 family membrane protein [Synechococcus sp. CS-1332]
MIYTIIVVLAALWLLGVVSSFTAGGLVHLLLVIALVLLVVNLLQGRTV